jgi:hypothetical protein
MSGHLLRCQSALRALTYEPVRSARKASFRLASGHS